MASRPRRKDSAETANGCLYCGWRLDTEFHYTCHICGAVYCFVHMQEHTKKHQREDRGYSSSWSNGAHRARLDGGKETTILTSDPEEIKLIRAYMLNLLGPSETARPLEQNIG